jgi:hypothetical protein
MAPVASRRSFGAATWVICLATLSLFNDVAAADDLWLAVGYGGRRMISADGVQWEITAEWAQPGKDDGNNLMSAVFVQEKFVVVGGGGAGPSAAGHILVSNDGRTWKEVFTGKARVNPVVFGNGRFVVGVSGYPSGKLMWSSDAEQWSPGAAIRTKGLTHFRGGAFGNGVFVLVGNAGGQGGRSWAVVTPDGEQITHERDNLPGHGAIVFGAGRFLMLTSHNQADLISSTDGADWRRMDFASDAKFNWLVWTGDAFLAGDGKHAWRSTEGIEWSQQPLPTRGNVKWSDGIRFIASSWPGKMAFSADGKTWRDAPPLPANGINVVVRGDSR